MKTQMQMQKESDARLGAELRAFLLLRPETRVDSFPFGENRIRFQRLPNDTVLVDILEGR